MKFKGLFSVILVIGTALAPAANAKVTLQFWHNWSGAGGMVMTQLINKYNASQDRVEVKTTQSSDSFQKLLTTTIAGTPPDVVVLDRYLTANYASRGVLLRLDPYVKKDRIDAGSFYKSAWQEVLLNGAIYGIPMTTDSRTLWYNRRMYEKAGIDGSHPPKTWGETRQYAEKLTQRNAAGELLQVGYVPTWEQGNVKLQYVWQNGGDIFSPDHQKVTFAAPPALEAFQWIIDFMDYYGPALIPFIKGNAMLNMYRERLAMVLNGPWMESEVVRNGSKEFRDNVRYAAVPYFKTPSVLAGGMGLVIPAGSKHKKEAWDLIRYITSYEAQVFFGANNGVIPALKTAAESKEYLNNPFRVAHVAQMGVTRPRPAHPAYPDVEELMVKALDLALAHKKGLEQALQTNLPAAQKILDRFNARYMKK